jgi:molybdate transport system regulatory protein
MGPGKADLLEAVGRRGNLRAAARDLGMSYMRAWKLVQLMNRAFRGPVIETGRGGAERGHAELTEVGVAVLTAYREMERRGRVASRQAYRSFLRLVRS